jgi:DNA-directed RNA polymerase subunit M/transcription elongation factor TFIIS
MCLEFCEKCNSIMVLKEKKGNIGFFVCRACQSTKNAVIDKIQIEEKITTAGIDPMIFLGNRGKFI